VGMQETLFVGGGADAGIEGAPDQLFSDATVIAV
jgi:hypothetical protein